MAAHEETKGQRAQLTKEVHLAYAQLTRLLNGDFSPGFFNRPEILAAEKAGLSVCDAVLGHVLSLPADPTSAARELEALNRIERAIDSNAVENMCHNLHAAVLGMLDLLGCPAIVVWGSLDARAEGITGFTLPAYRAPLFSGQRPGHSWVVTPNHTVIDLAIAHQSNVGDDYKRLKPKIPRLVLSKGREKSEPKLEWFRIPGAPHLRIPQRSFAHETKYHELLGWTVVDTPVCSLRYLPGGVSLPSEADLDDIRITIGGQRPGRFFEDRLSDLLER